MQLSNVTLQPFPTLQEAVRELLDGYLDTNGYGDFYDLFKVLCSEKHEDIVRELISQAEDLNDREMLAHGLCSNCGERLIYKPNLERYDCSNGACMLSYSESLHQFPLAAKIVAEYGEMKGEAV